MLLLFLSYMGFEHGFTLLDWLKGFVVSSDMMLASLEFLIVP